MSKSGILITYENQDYDLVLNLLDEKLGVAFDISMIDRSHSLGPIKGENNLKPRPMIVKFCSYRIRKAVFTTERKLKGSGVSVTESLTKWRMKLLNEVQKVIGEGNSWTVDRFVFVKQGRRIIKITKKHNSLKILMVALNFTIILAVCSGRILDGLRFIRLAKDNIQKN